MTRSDSRTISFRIPADTLAALERLAETTGQPRSWHLEQALDAYLNVQAWQVEDIKKAIAELDAGKGIPHEEVKKMVLGWGKGDGTEEGN